MQDSGTITRQLRLVSRCVAAWTRDPELALANKLQWTPKTKACPAGSVLGDPLRFPDQELWEPAAKIGGIPRDEPLPVHCETTDQNIGNRAFRHFVGTPALHI